MYQVLSPFLKPTLLNFGLVKYFDNEIQKKNVLRNDKKTVYKTCQYFLLTKECSFY